MITTPSELQTSCVFEAMTAHCARHPHIIIQMITTPCELQTPWGLDGMAAHCAKPPDILIQMITTTTQFVYDVIAPHLRRAPKHIHTSDYDTMRVTNSMCFRCHGSTLCHASTHNRWF